MFKPIGDLFTSEKRVRREDDIRYVVQDFIQRTLGVRDIHCQAVVDGKAVVKVASPAQYQAVYVLLSDIQQMVLDLTEYTLRRVQVVL